MAVTKRNTYVPGVNSDITNALVNVDLNRIGTDISQIVWSGSQYVLKAGTITEANGSMYTNDADINLGNTAGYLTFNSSTLTYSISAVTPAFDPAKGGFYSSSTVRVLNWYMKSGGTFGANWDEKTLKGIRMGYGATNSGTDSMAIGLGASSSGANSTSVGYQNSSGGSDSSSIGRSNVASNTDSSAFGNSNDATGGQSSSYGYNNSSSNTRSSTFGANNTSSGQDASALGSSNTSTNTDASAVGRLNDAAGLRSSAFGYDNEATGQDSSAFGFDNSAGDLAVSMGRLNTAPGLSAGAFGVGCNASGQQATAVGNAVTAPCLLQSTFGSANSNISLIDSTCTQAQLFSYLEAIGSSLVAIPVLITEYRAFPSSTEIKFGRAYRSSATKWIIEKEDSTFTYAEANQGNGTAIGSSFMILNYTSGPIT